MRLHLFEIEDFAWYPSFLRELQTDYLRKLMDVFKVYKAIIPEFLRFLRDSSQSRVVDLCSGGGGSWNQILPLIHDAELKSVTLTDLYPNISAFKTLKDKYPTLIDYRQESVNAVNPPEHLEGMKTFFNSFHHFRSEDALAILKTATSHKQAIAIFEPMEKSLLQYFLNTISTFFLCFLFTPFIQPFRWDRILFTYFIPIVPIVTLWDGWVSLLRLYTPSQLISMANEADPEYEWESGLASHTFGRVTYLMGRPKKKAE